MKKIILLFLACIFLAAVSAQGLYTVRVGVFRDVKVADFAQLKGLGFVYGTTAADQTVEVFVGQYADQNKATAVAADLTTKGFRNAQAFTLPTATGQPVTVIQIALYAGNRPIDWATLEKAGQLYVESVDGVSKIMTGIYPDATTAANFLPAIRELGYQDAFIKQINNVRLIPITPFETGIKKPLIPISLQEAPSTLPPPENTQRTGGAPQTYGNDPDAVKSPAPPPFGGSGGTTSPAPATAPTTLPATAAAAGLPEIDGKTKRHSAAELQRVLKEKGFYEGAIDGFYGPGTAAAYDRAWAAMPEVRKYRLLSTLAEPARDAVSQWPEVAVLLAVSTDLAAGTGNAERARQLLEQRTAIFSPNGPLSPAMATRVKTWAATIWANLDEWATEDPLHTQVFSAFRVSYHQAQVRLEDRYMDQGMSAIDARDMATAMLQNLIGAQLDRFL
ncbi:SPOR domain-containing protein [Neolewinella lacunae]|uniref:SPOR domain-containing protein n=1 Tax=Neolewinella lacunae TaxID=1517758 RepID=A0A923PHL7_9BACT|nr:SPOR domain-containing protein [Neolewinella lacunae]MBC6994230.1 SPOR domain-containing protein [Neolewinella lacunae]MDN3634611.1 SPOR domain-containing protein [Neolewinella lacunae]